jgi:hypothetical protein
MRAMNEKKAPRRVRVFAALVLSVVMSVMSAAFMTTSASAESHTSAVCDSKASGAPFKWGPVSKECSYTSPPSGWDGKLKVTWSVQPGTNQTACVEARMGKAKDPDKWQSVGCGTNGSGEIRWPKNTMSNVEVRVKSGNVHMAIVAYSI